MLKRLVLIFALAALGICPGCAEALARAPAAAREWAEFDHLVATSKQAMMADPKSALESARLATSYAERQPASSVQQQAIATGLWLQAESLTRTNQVTEARRVLDKAIRITSADQKLTRLDGELALSLARLAHADGDVALALKSYQHAHDIFVQTGYARGQSIALQGLGTIYNQARDLPREIDYYKKAEQVYSAEPPLQLSIENNLGFALQQAGRYEQSLAHFQKALTIARSLNSAILQARILTNIASVQTKLRNYSPAQSAANEALRLLGKNGGSGWMPFVWGVKAEIEFARGGQSAATADIERAFRGVDITKTIAPFRDIHEIAYRIYSANGNYQRALAHLEAFKRLDDEGRILTASANLALMAARFDFANQALEIEHLKTEQLRREASLKESRAAMQMTVLLSAILLSLAFIVWMAWRHQMVRDHRDAISKANIELKKILGERDEEIVRRTEVEAHLRVAIEAAEQASRAKTKFLANMSHELRTPLNAIIGFSEIISSGIVPPAKAQEYSSDINASGRKLLFILNDILDTARLDAGSVSLTESNIELDRTVAEAVAKVSKAAAEADKHIAVTGEAGVRVRGDAQRLGQVLEKLLSNAVKFTAENGHIEVSVRRIPECGVEITVRDDGIGIPGEQVQHIMDRFGQVESAYSRTYGGIGLGLPIANSLIALHGGTLSIESEVDKGTSVRIHLPAERILAAEASRTAAA